MKQSRSFFLSQSQNKKAVLWRENRAMLQLFLCDDLRMRRSSESYINCTVSETDWQVQVTSDNSHSQSLTLSLLRMVFSLGLGYRCLGSEDRLIEYAKLYYSYIFFQETEPIWPDTSTFDVAGRQAYVSYCSALQYVAYIARWNWWHCMPQWQWHI